MSGPGGRRSADAAHGPAPEGGHAQTRGAAPSRPPAPGRTWLRIDSDQDIVTARQRGRALAEQAGFSNSGLTLIATAISELTRNILSYAERGEISLAIVEQNGRKGISVVARDEGPGIPDVSRALEIGYSTSGSLGLGLPGVRRLMDEFEIDTAAGRGTTVTARKWAQ